LTHVRWGIVGTGAIAELFAKALQSVDGAVLHGVASRTRTRAEMFAGQFGFRRAYSSYEQLLSDSAIDIVYIATRNQYHREDSLAAISAGKAVLCEKPFALNAVEGQEVAEAARRRGVFCMEAMWMRCSPAVRDVIEMVQRGAIGKPVFVTAQFGVPVYFDPLHRVYAKPGGGALFDLGVYPFSLVHALLGRPLAIHSRASLAPTGVDDQFTAILDYESGCQAVISASLRTQLTNSATVHATEGVLDSLEPIFFPQGYHVLTPISHFQPQMIASKRPLHLRAWSRLMRGRTSFTRPGTDIRRQVANGYAAEIEVVQRCLQSGSNEAPEMPLDETVDVLVSMDATRAAWADPTA
jgi:predicted dehydrogenase